MSIARRAWQFFTAFGARLTEDDRAYVQKFLPRRAERELFYAMSVIDCRHAINTAKTAEKLLAEDAAGERIDARLLIRAALLHDTGRKNGDMGLWGKVFAVLATKFFPGFCQNAATDGQPPLPFANWRHILYIYYRHAEIGAEKLRAINLPAEAQLVAAHHLPPANDDSPELIMLRRADELN